MEVETAVAPTPDPTNTSLPPATATLTPDTGWLRLQTGLERRLIRIGDSTAISILRLEPEMFTFRLGYQPREPQGLREWQAQEQALITVNGGYFTEEFLATGRIVVDGVGSGSSYGSFAGMLTVTDDGRVDIRWLEQQPYTGDDGLAYALQSFPLLVKPIGELGFPDETGRSAARTVIGMDANGRFLILLTTPLTLHETSVWLTESDLALQVALNLDGGPSSGLILQEPFWEIPSYVPLPAVLLIDPRSEGD